MWYARYEAERLIADIKDSEIRQRTEKVLAKAKNVCVVEDVFPKLADRSGETPTIKEDPPFIYHHLERGEDEFYARIEEVFRATANLYQMTGVSSSTDMQSRTRRSRLSALAASAPFAASRS